MGVSRRQLLKFAAGVSAAAAVGELQLTGQQSIAGPETIKAIAFDAFVIFDPRSVAKRVEEIFPGKGTEFTNLWRTRQFEYSWLRTAGLRYVDFWQVTKDALNYTANNMKLSLSPAQRERLMNAYRELPYWPDVPDALAKLRRRGIRMGFLTNFTVAMLDVNLAASKLRGYFEEHLSTDRVRLYKPSPHAYQMGVDHFGLQRNEIAFAAFGAWDAAGAKWFGYPTVWVNRANVQPEELVALPDATTPDIRGLLDFVGSKE